jgi:hypothetical protein
MNRRVSNEKQLIDDRTAVSIKKMSFLANV